MKALELKLDQLLTFHKLLEKENTGCSHIFSKKLRISRTKLFKIKEAFEDKGAKISYCFKRKTFYYQEPFEVLIKFVMQPMDDDELSKIQGGYGSGVLTFFDKNY